MHGKERRNKEQGRREKGQGYGRILSGVISEQGLDA